MGRPIECTCAGCVSRRLADQRWNAKNKEKKLAINRKSKRLAAERIDKSRAEVSDEELDRRALEMGL